MKNVFPRAVTVSVYDEPRKMEQDRLQAQRAERALEDQFLALHSVAPHITYGSDFLPYWRRLLPTDVSAAAGQAVVDYLGYVQTPAKSEIELAGSNESLLRRTKKRT